LQAAGPERLVLLVLRHERRRLGHRERLRPRVPELDLQEQRLRL